MDYVNITEAARMVHRSEKTVRRWLHQSKIEHKISRGQYWISVDAINALAPSGISEGHNTLQDQIEALTARIERLEHIVEARPAPVTPAHAVVPARPRPTHLIKNGTLPGDLVGYASFAKQHNIAVSTTQKAIESGRLPATRGRWKTGKTWTELALNPEQQRRFVELFVNNPGWKDCPDCPHNV